MLLMITLIIAFIGGVSLCVRNSLSDAKEYAAFMYTFLCGVFIAVLTILILMNHIAVPERKAALEMEKYSLTSKTYYVNIGEVTKWNNKIAKEKFKASSLWFDWFADPAYKDLDYIK